MALWQFELDLIPAMGARVAGADAIQLSREQLDAIPLRLSNEDMSKLFGWLESLLPEKASWSKDLRIWGDEKTDDVQVSFAGEKIEFVQFRINVGNLSLALVSGICAIARNLDCVLASRQGAIVRPTSEAVVRAVLQSPATRFVRDPKAYLEAAVLIDGSND
ncbi:hypothetical protein [Novosphingobium sp. Rr 2-17]|uniref:hypothetical protein n=1 Tax=Novosphingobium sp. Rr 2-17 TaxID=555793 RepID=UPI0005BE5B44|nr:hypothetical protein [Novosphingobium sp. Rr 2-17]